MTNYRRIYKRTPVTKVSLPDHPARIYDYISVEVNDALRTGLMKRRVRSLADMISDSRDAWNSIPGASMSLRLKELHNIRQEAESISKEVDKRVRAKSPPPSEVHNWPVYPEGGKESHFVSCMSEIMKAVRHFNNIVE